MMLLIFFVAAGCLGAIFYVDATLGEDLAVLGWFFAFIGWAFAAFLYHELTSQIEEVIFD